MREHERFETREVLQVMIYIQKFSTKVDERQQVESGQCKQIFDSGFYRVHQPPGGTRVPSNKYLEYG